MARKRGTNRMTDVCSEESGMIVGSLAGKPEAFSGIVAKYQSQVCSVAYSMTGDLALSEDLAQEAFLTAWQKLSELRDRGKLGAWLCGIVRNIARDTVRRKQRDVAHNALPLEEDVAEVKAPPLGDRVNQTEREAVMWAALEDIPGIYREPLVIFYREGGSIRDVAEALDISEDCVKQRLARGRKMLKAQVAAFVEESLASTGPTRALTAAVVAKLPPLATTPAAGAAGAAGATAAVTAGVLGILLANLVYMTWGFFGMWTAIRDARTLRIRRHMLKVSALSYGSIWGFFGLQGLIGTLLWRSPVAMYAAVGLIWVAYIVWLFILVTGSRLKCLRIQEEESGIQPAPVEALEESEFSRRRTWICFAWTGAVALLGSLFFLLWLQTSALWGLPLVVLSHGIFVPLFIKGMRIARDQEVFFATAPCAISPYRQARADTLSVLLGGGMGLVVAPGIWGLGLGILAGDWAGAAVIGAVIVTVTVLTARAFNRGRGMDNLNLLWSPVFMGFFVPAVIVLKWPEWASAVNWTIGPADAWASAAVYFGINTCFVVSELVLYRKFKGRGRPNDSFQGNHNGR